MSSNYIKVTVCPGLNLRPSISFVDRMRVEADGRQLTEDVERKLTMVLAKKVFAPQIEYIEQEMNRLAEMPYNIGTFYEAEEFFRRIIADYDASHKQTVEMELETLILVPRTNTYINLNHCSTPDEFKAEVIEGVSRFAFKGFTKPLRREHIDGINKLLDTHFTPEEIEYIYTNLGNGINHELCMKFVKSGYDLKVIEESV